MMWPTCRRRRPRSTLRQAVLNNPMVYGLYVDAELKSALIQVDFHDHLVDYGRIFPEIQAIPTRVQEGTGQPAPRRRADPVAGWVVAHYLGETVAISLLSLVMMLVLLFVISSYLARHLLPLLAGLVWCDPRSASAACSATTDPLVIVVAFIITARFAFGAADHALTTLPSATGRAATGGVSRARELFRSGHVRPLCGRRRDPSGDPHADPADAQGQ